MKTGKRPRLYMGACTSVTPICVSLHTSCYHVMTAGGLSQLGSELVIDSQ